MDMFTDFHFDEGETLYLAKSKSIFYYIFHVGNLKRFLVKQMEDWIYEEAF